MRKWTRWQDWVVLVAGVYAILSPLWTDTTTTATWTMIVLGVVAAAAALWSLAMPGVVWSEWSHVLMGVLFVISPWVMGFVDTTAMAVTAWIVGAVTIVAGAWASLQVNRGRHMHPAAGH